MCGLYVEPTQSSHSLLPLCSPNTPLPRLMLWILTLPSQRPLHFLRSPTPRLQSPLLPLQQHQTSKICFTTHPLPTVPAMTFMSQKSVGLFPLKGPQNQRMAGAVREQSAFLTAHRLPRILPRVSSSWSVLQTSRKSPCLVVWECHLMKTLSTQGSQFCLPWSHHPT